MENFDYVIKNFFTHKDYLAPASEIPGTLYTPLHFIFESILILIIVCSAIFISKRKHLIKRAFTFIWGMLMILEVLIVTYDSVAGEINQFDFANSLSLYPCSIFLYSMPFVIWGKGVYKKIACGYICTLGFLGALLNFLYPISRLTTYSCISFAGFHTFIFHGSMLFTFLVLIISKEYSYRNITCWWELFLPCVASLLVSIPANIINYSPIDADYMYFKGKFFALQIIFQSLPEFMITIILYALYIFIPALFYLPSYISNKRSKSINE